MSETAVADSGTRLQNFLDRAGLRGFPWKTATILYTISWGWLFIVRDSFWGDDWDQFVFRTAPFYDGYGFPPWADLGFGIFKTFGSAFIRTLIFIMFFIVAGFFYAISEKFSWLNGSQRKILTLMFLLLPFNTARLTLFVFHYSVAYFLFYCAWYFSIAIKSVRSRLISCILFFLSFQMFALLVFFLLPVCHLFFLEGRGSKRSAINWIRRNLVFIFLPVIYWVLRMLFWPARLEYHSLSIEKVIGFSKVMFLLFLLLVVLTLLFFRSGSPNETSILQITIGLLAMFGGYVAHVFYGLVGYGFRVPLTYMVTMLGRSDWFSRHQFLQPLGFSILLVGLIGLLSGFAKRFKQWFIGMILAMAESPLGEWEFDLFVDAITIFSTSFIVTVMIGLILLKYLPKSSFASWMVLKENLDHVPEELPESIQMQDQLKVGDIGLSMTALRKYGSAKFFDKTIEVVSEHEYIDANEKIEIIRIHSNTVTVKKVTENQ